MKRHNTVHDLPYCIKPSNIHGQGVIATRLIRQGDLVPMPLPRHFHLLVGAKSFGGFNHSCQNNLSQHVDPEMDFREALRDIHPEEELTVSYLAYMGSMYDPDRYDLPFLCRCPACTNCL